MNGLDIQPALVEAILVKFLRSEAGKFGFSRAVLGLSGGVDSAVSAALAARAFGPKNVLGVMMPYKTSNPDSEGDARVVAEKLGIETRKVDISAMVDGYCDVHAVVDRVRRGNAMARSRMIVLYDLSAEWKGLVIGTSNKTEILLGYSTVFGDNASSLNPLGDLYKAQVWQLSRHLGLPSAVIDKAPSADLFPGQTDEGDLGFDYRTADEVLYLLFDEGLRPDEVVARGYDERVVQQILTYEQRFRFKRRLMLIARLSGSAVNLDQEIPRD